MHYEEDDPSAHQILEQHLTNASPITAKAIGRAIREHEELTHAYKRTCEELAGLKSLYDQLTKERTNDLLEKRGSDAVVNAIKELTDVVRLAWPVPQVLNFDGPMTGDAVDRMMAETRGFQSVLPPPSEGAAEAAGSFNELVAKMSPEAQADVAQRVAQSLREMDAGQEPTGELPEHGGFDGSGSNGSPR